MAQRRYEDVDGIDNWEEIAGDRLTEKAIRTEGKLAKSCASCKCLLVVRVPSDAEDGMPSLRLNCSHWDRVRKGGTKSRVAGSLSMEGVFNSGCLSGYSPWEEAQPKGIDSNWLDVTAKMKKANEEFLAKLHRETAVTKFSEERKKMQSVLDNGWPKEAVRTPAIAGINLDEIATARQSISL